MNLVSRKPREILHSKRGNLEYLEYGRVLVKNGRVVYLLAKARQRHDCDWNIPIANTTALLLGPGTSITQSAVRMLAEAGGLIGFSFPDYFMPGLSSDGEPSSGSTGRTRRKPFIGSRMRLFACEPELLEDSSLISRWQRFDEYVCIGGVAPVPDSLGGHEL